MMCYELKFERFDAAQKCAAYLEASGYDVRLMGCRVVVNGRLSNADIIKYRYAA